MPVQNRGVLDAIGVDEESGVVTLAIIDSLDWADEEEHLLLLQEKINAYLGFLESGDVYSAYEPAVGRDEFEIKVHFKYQIPEFCEGFLAAASKIISEAGFSLTYKVTS